VLRDLLFYSWEMSTPKYWDCFVELFLWIGEIPLLWTAPCFLEAISHDADFSFFCSFYPGAQPVSSSSRRQSRDDYNVRRPAAPISSPMVLQTPHTAAVPGTAPPPVAPNLVPQRAAPSPPIASTSYRPFASNSNSSLGESSSTPPLSEPSTWVVPNPDDAGVNNDIEKAVPVAVTNGPTSAGFRQSASVSPKPARSSYIAGSRPPFSTQNSGSSVQSSSTRTQNRTSSHQSGFSVGSPSTSPIGSPGAQRPNPASYIPTGLGGTWEIVEEVDAEDRPRAAAVEQPHHQLLQQPAGSGEQDQHVLSLLTDPATAAAAGYVAHSSAPSESSATTVASPPPLQPHEYGLPPADSQWSAQYVQQQPAGGTNGGSSSYDSMRKRRSQSFGDKPGSRGDKSGSTIKGVLGSFFGNVGGMFSSSFFLCVIQCRYDGKLMIMIIADLLSNQKRMEISTPYDPRHVTHVGFNNDTGEFTVRFFNMDVTLWSARSRCFLFCSRDCLKNGNSSSQTLGFRNKNKPRTRRL
jgi:hypothetical protein